MIYSGIWRRFLAFTIDCCVIIGLLMAVNIFLVIDSILRPLLALPMLGFWFYGGLGVISWLYFAGLESSSLQGTLGKYMLGIKVTNMQGGRITFLQATCRHFVRAILKFLFVICALCICLTKKKQAIHDKIAKTVVVIKCAEEPSLTQI